MMDENTNAEKTKKPQPKSYLIFDTETTGLPGPYGNPRITELCLLGVHRADMLEDGVIIPRVVNKLQLCINPQKRVTPGSCQITGLFNDALERQSPLNNDMFAMIRAFILAQAQPSCFIAHNGDKFDFPLLISELARVGEHLPQDLLCADSLLAFRELDAEPEDHSSHADVKGQSSCNDVNGQSSCNDVNGQSSHDDVKGQGTWEINEATPVKRSMAELEPDSSFVKKRKKEENNETHRVSVEGVVRRLNYAETPNQTRCENSTEMTNQNQLQEFEDKLVSCSNSKSERSCVVTDTQPEHNQKLTDKCDSSNESKNTHLQTSCCTGSLPDEDLLAAVNDMETNHWSDSGCKENKNSDESQPSTSGTFLVSTENGPKLITSTSEENLQFSSHEKNLVSIISSCKDSESLCEISSRNEENSLFDLDQAADGKGTTVGGTTVEIGKPASETLSSCLNKPFKSDISSNAALSRSCIEDRPAFISEKTVLYEYQPTEKLEKTTPTELNSQGSLPDTDFLAAVQSIENFNASEIKTVTESKLEEKCAHTGYMNFLDSQNNNTAKDIKTETYCDKSAKILRADTSCVGNSIPNQPNSSNNLGRNESPSHGRRRSYRLPEIYKRHFGQLPSCSHTAEHDCIALLKLVKRFSPRFLEWVDEHCVPFETVQPLY